MEKRCFKCGSMLSISEFYRHPMMSDGHLNKCKTCTKRDVRQNRSDNIQHYREYDAMRCSDPDRVKKAKAYAKSDRGRAVVAKAHAKQREKYPERVSARAAVATAIQSGRLKKMPCCKCGSLRSHGHHEDYSKPLDVVWLCSKHHREVHKTKKGTT